MCTRCDLVYPESLRMWINNPCAANCEKAVRDVKLCLRVYDSSRNSKGLICGGKLHNMVHDIDSVHKICNNYDCRKACEGICTVLNILCFGMFVDGAELFASLNMHEQSLELKEKAMSMESAIVETLYDKKLGLFKDADCSEHHSLCANAAALAFGIRPKSGNELIASYVKGKCSECGEFFADVVARALANIGDDRMAKEVIDRKSRR